MGKKFRRAHISECLCINETASKAKIFEKKEKKIDFLFESMSAGANIAQ